MIGPHVSSTNSGSAAAVSFTVVVVAAAAAAATALAAAEQMCLHCTQLAGAHSGSVSDLLARFTSFSKASVRSPLTISSSQK